MTINSGVHVKGKKKKWRKRRRTMGMKVMLMT